MIREKRKLAFKNLYAGVAFVSIAFIAFQYKSIMYSFGAIGTLFFIFYFYLSFKYWKCPTCGEQFPVVYSRMDERTECWYCLASIEDRENIEKTA